MLKAAIQHHQSGRLVEAKALYRRVLNVDGRHADALHLLGVIDHQIGRNDDAVNRIGKAIAINGTVPLYYLNYGVALKALGRLDDTLASFDVALRLKPDSADAHCERAYILQQLGRIGEALNAFEAASRLKPDSAETHANRGTALKELGRIDEAVAAYDVALRINPNFAEAHYNRAMMLLLLGQFEDGWRGYEYRWHVKARPGGQRRHTDSPRWRGEPGGGRTILLWAEAGFGDSIHFVRYVPMVIERGWRVVLEVPSPLTRLFAGIAGATVVAVGESLPPFDAQCPLLSLPLAHATTAETIPAAGPYLAARRDAVAMWSNRLPREGLRVGIAWQGNPAHTNDRNRSFRLDELARLAALPGVKLISLQKGAGVDQLANLSWAASIHTLGADYDAGDFLDTAAVVMALDLVIGVDTSVVHLAGALGRPAWVALPWVPDWRWLEAREDSPWYPTVRLFRQNKPGDWDGVFVRIAGELCELQRIAAAASLRLYADGAHSTR